MERIKLRGFNYVTVSGEGADLTVTFKSEAFDKFVDDIHLMAHKASDFELDFEKHLKQALDSYKVFNDMNASMEEEIAAENKEWLAEYLGIENYKRD